MRMTELMYRFAQKYGLMLLGLFLGLLCSFLFPRSTGNLSNPNPQLHVTDGTVEKKSTFYQSLLGKKIPVQWITLIVSELKTYVNFNRMEGGTYFLFTDEKGELVRFVFEKSPLEVYSVKKGPQGYVTQKEEVSLERHIVKIEGEIHTSLFEAINAIGEQEDLTLSFAEILAWEIDFYQDVRKGDRFKMVVEKMYKGDQWVQYGVIHGVEYQRREKTIRGIFYQGSYYDENGNSLRRAFLKAPLRFDRISSRFSGARQHPILGGVYPHYGVDYAAPTGTPVWAVADGTVVSAGWSPGFGKQVILSHRNGYKTYYGHLSRYGLGIKAGRHVQQKEIIGYVGSTGLSTGPHLDYRLSQNGFFKNPLKATLSPGKPIGRNEIRAFQKRRDEIVALFQRGATLSKDL
jgi:murein DD-endopeptidase MepM/ murein hydrolase activator NlpD